MNEILDCAVVGSGPAALSAAVNLHQRKKSLRLLGSSPNLLDKAEKVENYLGLPGLTGQDMMAAFKAHAQGLGLRGEAGKVVNILPLGDSFMLNFNGQILNTRSVILCSGVYHASPLPGETELLGRGVSYCATCDGMLYRHKRVVVWGMSESAPREADFLSSLGCQVTFVAAKPPEGNHSFSFRPGRLTAIEGDATVRGAVVGKETLACEGVFLLREGLAPTQLVPGLALAGGHIQVNRSQATNLPGLFAAGDCTGEPYQVAKAVGEGLVAALSAAAYLDKLKKEI